MATSAAINHSLDNESRGHVLTTVVIIFLVVSSVVLGLRMYTRMHIVSHCGPEDYAIVAAWVSHYWHGLQ